MRQWEAALERPASKDPASCQVCINGIATFMQPILDLVAEFTGMRVTFLMGGPEPAAGGRLNIIGMHSGGTKGPVQNRFPEAEPEKYHKMVIPAFSDFLRKCYTREDCQASALPSEAHSQLEYATNDQVTYMTAAGENHSPPDQMSASVSSSSSVPATQTSTSIPSSFSVPATQQNVPRPEDESDDNGKADAEQGKKRNKGRKRKSGVKSKENRASVTPSVLQRPATPEATGDKSNMLSNETESPYNFTISAPDFTPDFTTSRSPHRIPFSLPPIAHHVQALTGDSGPKVTRPKDTPSLHPLVGSRNISSPHVLSSPLAFPLSPTSITSPLAFPSSPTSITSPFAFPSSSLGQQSSSPSPFAPGVPKRKQVQHASKRTGKISASRPVSKSHATRSLPFLQSPLSKMSRNLNIRRSLQHSERAAAERQFEGLAATVGQDKENGHGSKRKVAPTEEEPSTKHRKTSKQRVDESNLKQVSPSAPSGQATVSAPSGPSNVPPTSANSCLFSPYNPVHHSAAYLKTQLPADCDPGIRNTLAMLCSVSWELNWELLTAAWIRFEKIHGFQGCSKFKPTFRPSVVGDWIKRTRSPTYRPQINVDEFQLAWWAWWAGLQPYWRSICDGNAPMTIGGPLDVLDKHGVNGFPSVLVGLLFWGIGLGSERRTSDSWVTAVRDVHWVLTELCGTYAD